MNSLRNVYFQCLLKQVPVIDCCRFSVDLGEDITMWRMSQSQTALHYQRNGNQLWVYLVLKVPLLPWYFCALVFISTFRDHELPYCRKKKNHSRHVASAARLLQTDTTGRAHDYGMNCSYAFLFGSLCLFCTML